MIFKQETIQSWFSGVGSSINNEVIQPFQNAEQVIWKYNQAIQHNSLTQQGWERLLAQSDDSLKAYLTSIKGTTATMTGYNISLQGNITGFKKVSSAITQYNVLSASGTKEQNIFANAVSATNGKLGTYLTGLNGAKASLGGYVISLVGATVKTVALKVATIALNSAITMGVSLIISGIVSAISEWIHKTENMISASEDAIGKIKSINDELKNNQKTISDTAKRYAELAQGVDQLTGKNISLSNEDYEEFLTLSNQLAEMFPTLTRNYNDNGDAIVQLSGDVDTIVGSLQNLIEAQRDLANRQIVDELPTVFDGVAAKSDKYEQQLSDLESRRDALGKSLTDVNFMEGLSNNWIEISGDDLEVISKIKDDYIRILEEFNIDFEELTPTYGIKDGIEIPIGFTIKTNSSDEDIEKIKDTINDKIKTLNEEINTTNEKNKANWASLSSSIFAWLSTDDSFKIMDDTMRATVQNIVNSLDWGSLDFSSWEDAKLYIQENILSLFNTSEGKETLADIKVMFGIQTQFNNGNIPVEQYQQKLQDFLNSIENLPLETKKSILLLFGIQTNDDGTTTSDVDTMVENVKKKLKGTEFDDKVGKLSLGDLKIAAEDLKVGDDTIQSWDELIAKIKEAKLQKDNTPPLSFADSLKELDKLTEAFSKVDKIYADVYDKEGFDFSNLFDDKFIETFGKYEEEYKNLIDTISKSPDDINACQSAFNNLVNAWFYGQDVLKNLNEENKNATIQYLKQNGIANAEAIVEERLAGARTFTAFTTGELKGSTDALTNATNALNEVTQDSTDTTREEANSAIDAAIELIGEGEGSDYAKLELEKLIATQSVFSQQDLSTADKIAKLEELATAFGDVTLKAMIASETVKAFGSATTRVYDDGTKIEYSAPDDNGNVGWKYYDSNGTVKGSGTTNVNANDFNYYEARQHEALKKSEEYLNTKKTTSVNYTGGSATQSAKDKKDKKDKKSKSGGSAKEHETNDEYYNFFQAKIEDHKNGADKLKKAIEETNEQIELAYKTGDTKLAKSLEAMLPQQTQKYKDYLAANAEAMRKMAKEEIYPIVYQIAPELKGKTIDQFSEEDKLKIKERLDNAITEQKNKVIDLENAQKDSDNKTKVSDADVKNAEKQLKILEELYSTLEKSYELVGNKAGEGEWSKNYREMINDQIDAIKDSLDKAIDQDEFNLSLFENMDNQEGMLNVYLQELDKYRKAVKDLKALGLSENSSEIQEQQKNYRETFEKIFELGKDTFEKLKKKREDALNTVEFKFEMLGDKEYEKQIELLNDETAIHQNNVNKIIERMNDLEERYRNNSIVAAEYEEEIRSLNEELKEEVQNLKSIAEQRRDIEISKLDDQIDDLTRATEKQTKAIDEKVDALEKESDELDKLKNLYDKAYSAIQKVVDDQIEELNDLKEQEEEYWDEKLEALEKINEETTRGIELSEKQKAIEEARQRTALVYHEDKGWVHEANPNDLSAAQQDLDQWLIDDQFEQAKKSIEEQKEASLNAIEEQIEAWDKYIEKWEDAVNAYEDGQDRIAASTVIGANWEKSTLAQREDIIRKFETNYSALLKQLDEDNKNSIENQIEELNKQKESIEKASDAQIEKLNNLKSAYEELFNNLSEDSVKWVESIIEKWDLDISVKEDLLKLLKTRKDELLNAKAEAEKPLAYNNDIVTIIKQMMGYSQKWSEAITQQDKDQLHEKNVGLADELNRKGLKVHFDNEKYSWFDENGNAIYSDEFLEKLEEEQKITDENNKSTDTNTDVTEDNTTSTNSNTNATKDNNKALKGTKDALNKATNIGNDIVDAAENLTDALNNKSISNSSSSGSTNSSSESSSSSSSDTITYPTDGTPYTYSSTLTEEDIETAAKWFEDNHKTNPGTDIKVIHGGVSTLSTDLINQLGLASGDLVALGKQLYYITGSGYSKITGSLVNKYAKGSKYIPYDQIALVNEEGDELIASKNSQGDITKLRKGDEVVPAKDTQTLMSLVDWVNDPNNANDPKYEEFSNILAMQKKFMDYLSNNSNSFDTIATIKNNKLLNDLSKGNILNNITTNNNNGMVNHNYNIQKVELNKADNAEDLFRGIENLARQRSMRR